MFSGVAHNSFRDVRCYYFVACHGKVGRETRSSSGSAPNIVTTGTTARPSGALTSLVALDFFVGLFVLDTGDGELQRSNRKLRCGKIEFLKARGKPFRFALCDARGQCFKLALVMPQSAFVVEDHRLVPRPDLAQRASQTEYP